MEPEPLVRQGSHVLAPSVNWFGTDVVFHSPVILRESSGNCGTVSQVCAQGDPELA
jgi:hypothetical protein